MILIAINILIACVEDPCSSVCIEVGQALNGCIDNWPAVWEDFNLRSEEDFTTTCQTTWSIQRSILEPRALDDAYEQCTESNAYLSNNVYTCDQLRAIYLLDETY